MQTHKGKIGPEEFVEIVNRARTHLVVMPPDDHGGINAVEPLAAVT